MSKKILFVVNDPDFFLSHRLPIAEVARNEGFNVQVATMGGMEAQKIEQLGFTHHTLPLSRSGQNPLNELVTLFSMWRLFSRLRPDLVHLVTIKPVLYGGIAARMAKVPGVISAISGLGFLFVKRSSLRVRLLRYVTLFLYRLAMGHPNQQVIFQNPTDMRALVASAGVGKDKIQVLHLITALESGGAEKILFDTVSGLKDQFNHRVIVLSKRGAYCQKFEKIGIPVEKVSIRLLWRLLFSERNQCLIHSYLYHSHIVSLLFKVIGYRVIWSIHSSIFDIVDFKTKIVSWLSYFVPNKIIYVSDFARNQHTKIGFTKQKSIVIYNGLDVNKFNNKNQCALAIDNNYTNIAMIARYDPVKDYSKFSSIASIALQLNPFCYFYLIGKGNNKSNKELLNLLERNQLLDNVKLMDEVDDISTILPCFDLLVSTSRAESFGLTILEAILSGVNVSTISLPIMDELLDNYSSNDGSLSDAEIAKIWIKKSENNLDGAIIRHVSDNYSLVNMIKSYNNLYKGCSI